MAEGLCHPDDVRAMATGSLMRPNRYREHYSHGQKKMIKWAT